MDYWQEVMQDDVYIIIQDEWKLIITSDKKNQWSCDLMPKELVINKYFNSEKSVIEDLEASKDEITRQLDEMREENSGEEGLFVEVLSDKGTISKGAITSRIKEIKGDADTVEELKLLHEYEKLMMQEAEYDREIKVAQSDLDKTVLNKYRDLTIEEIKTLIVDDKWMKTLESSVNSEMDRISQRLMQRIKELVERYAEDLPSIEKEAEELSAKVDQHLVKMGFNI